MADDAGYSLVPVDYQPEFDHSLVRVDYDPFADESPVRMAQAQQQSLIVKRDGTVMRGKTRIYILQQRGFDVNSLPRIPHDE